MVLLMPKSLRGGQMMPIEISHPIQQMVQEMSQWCRSILDRHFHGNLNRMSDHFNTVLQRHFRDDPFFPVFQRSNVASLVRTNSTHEDGNKLRMRFDMLQFSPSEVSVKVSGNTLVVEARQKEKKEGYSYVRRYFRKRYLLPSDIDTQSFKSNFSSDNVLTVTAQRQKDLHNTSPSTGHTEIIIPVQIEKDSKLKNSGCDTKIPVHHTKDSGESFKAADCSRLSSNERIIPVSVSDGKIRSESAKSEKCLNTSHKETIIPVSMPHVNVIEGVQKNNVISSEKLMSGDLEGAPINDIYLREQGDAKETIIPVCVSQVELHNEKSKNHSEITYLSGNNERIVPVTIEERKPKNDLSTQLRQGKTETGSRIIPIQMDESKTVERPMRVSDLGRKHFPSNHTSEEAMTTTTQDVFRKMNENMKNEVGGLKETKEKYERREHQLTEDRLMSKLNGSDFKQQDQKQEQKLHDQKQQEQKPVETVIPVHYDMKKLDKPITSSVSLINVQSSTEMKGERIIPIQIENGPTETVKPTQVTETLEIEKTHPSQLLQTRDLSPSMRTDPVWEMLQMTSRRYKSLLDRVFKNDLKEVVEKFNNAWDVSKSHTEFLTDSSIFSSSAINEEADHYDVKIDVKNFTPEQLAVKVFNNCVYVEGKHEEKKEDTGFVSRHFSRKYQLPAHVNEWKIKSDLTRDGVLVVTAPKTSVESSICHERIIPITLPTDDSERGVIIREMSVCSSGTAPSDYEVDMSV